MYSLYRAWLMRDAVTATLSSPPDVLINVGSHHMSAAPKYHQFPAHRHVLTAHSGYLKALLASTPGQAVTVPNVGPEAFGPLLAYMYTGYLDINADNIYAVLLATHLLHIPRALELCRNYLLQNQPQGLNAIHLNARLDNDIARSLLVQQSHHHLMKPNRSELPAIVKPIPSRKMLPLLYDLNPPNAIPPPAGFWPHLPYPVPHPPVVLPNDNSSFKTVLPTVFSAHNSVLHQSTSSVQIRDTLPPIVRVTTPVKAATKKRSKSPLAIPSTSSNKKNVLMTVRSPIRSSSISPCLSDSSCGSNEVNVNISSDENDGKSEKIKKNGTKFQCNNGGLGYKGKVIIDVACCDGPVRFHRVLNDNYGLALEETSAKNTEENVGITSMRKELATKRNAEMNSPVIRKKIAKLAAGSHGEKTDHSLRINHVEETVSINNQKDEKVLVIYESSSIELTELKTPSHSVNETQVGNSRDSLHLASKQVQPVESNIIKCVGEDLKNVSGASISNVDSGKCDFTRKNAEQIRITEFDANNHRDRPGKPDVSLNAVDDRAETSAHENTVNSTSQLGSSVYLSNQSACIDPDQPGSSTDQNVQSDPAFDCSDQSDDFSKCNQTPPPKSGPDSIYTCVYCNHTFKSNYCYQKHARRHINPVALDAARNKAEAVCAKAAEKSAGNVRREVKLLDMNVQYYPCKTCGSKFPSYYFVHKHRKLCHADEGDDPTGSEESHSQSATISSV